MNEERKRYRPWRNKAMEQHELLLTLFLAHPFEYGKRAGAPRSQPAASSPSATTARWGPTPTTPRGSVWVRTRDPRFPERSGDPGRLPCQPVGLAALRGAHALLAAGPGDARGRRRRAGLFRDRKYQRSPTGLGPPPATVHLGGARHPRFGAEATT